MLSTKEVPSLSSLFSAFASITASIMFLQSMVYQILPHQVRDYLISILRNLIFKAHTPTQIAFVFDKESAFGGLNQIYEAASVYLQTLRGPGNKRLNVSKSLKEKGLIIRLETGETVTDSYDGMELQWRFVCSRSEEDRDSPGRGGGGNRQCYELSFHNEDEGKVCDSYIPFVLDSAKTIREERRVLKMHTYSPSSGMNWQSVNLDHPATFETVAMDVKKKTKIMEDLNRFVKRKEFYKKVGRAWKRGYLLYGPPGTGKSSLVAAMANHLKFDIYDLQLANVRRDSELRRLLLATGNRSILVIEDIDCSVNLPDRLHGGEEKKSDPQYDKNSINGTSLTLSGLLNFVDGLWSSCGDERIIIFTTNHKERLDPALLRPGRMDMHIHMGYCTYEAFKQLASNYLEISGDHHHLYGEIQGLLEETPVTPAQVAEEMMKDEDAESALEGLVDLLKQKKMKGDECDHAKVDEKKWQIC
ncbi:Spastin [Trema orientale]|uniref:Spastin n=1 Tax=Trema orientale TaxID=63057 RepID=A0A2P5FP79_TREOI|nr:Spastin [Trema orientale]